MSSPPPEKKQKTENSATMEEPEETSFVWLEEGITKSLIIKMRLNRMLLDTKSDFQRVQVVESEQFGKTLMLDGKTQSSRADEFIYHESLVHPALLMHPNPKRIYIGGGGELATARECLRHKSVEKVVMVDIDEFVVKFCQEHLPEWGDGCCDDDRLDLHYDDAKAFLERSEDKYDVIVMDIADPIEAGPGYVLYTEEFYKFATSRLNEGGILVTQSGPGSVLNYDECFTVIHNTLKQAFPFVVPYSVDIPSFGSNWGFNSACMNDLDIANTDPTEIDQRIASRISKLKAKPLRHYDGICHRGVFHLPKTVRDAVNKEERVMTVDKPVFMY